jgi:hypothetical protein
MRGIGDLKGGAQVQIHSNNTSALVSALPEFAMYYWSYIVALIPLASVPWLKKYVAPIVNGTSVGQTRNFALSNSIWCSSTVFGEVFFFFLASFASFRVYQLCLCISVCVSVCHDITLCSKTTLVTDVVLNWMESSFAAYEGRLMHLYRHCCGVARHVISESAVILLPEVYMKRCYATLHSRLVLIVTNY